MENHDITFRQRVEGIVQKIPTGRVMSYGDIAALCGQPRAARIVGGIAHFGNPELPWHRVVKKDGSLAEGYPGGIPAHEKHLRDEGVVFLPNGHVDMKEAQWRPELADGKTKPHSNSQLPSSTVAPLLVIVGPTASGKTALAIEIAEKFNGEIICADSRTVYKYLDIGTAKPSVEERARVPHHVLDVVNPDERFTVADFKRLANAAATDIRSRGKIPILVGGSGLYIDAVIFDYQFSDTNAPRSLKNERHLAKAGADDRAEILPGTSVLGMDVPRDVLKQRITKRVDVMIDAGFLEEVRMVREKYPGTKALDAPGYKAFGAYIDGDITIDEAKALFIKNDFQLARRQITWFKRNLSIQWLNDPRQYVDTITTTLNKLQ